MVTDDRPPPSDPRGATRRGLEVVLRCGEYVVDGGHAKVNWLLEVSAGWVPVGRAPGARLEDADQRPRVVWEQEVHLPVAPGARLQRVVSRPRRERHDALDYLLKAPRTVARHTQRVDYVVNARGELAKARKDE